VSDENLFLKYYANITIAETEKDLDKIKEDLKEDIRNSNISTVHSTILHLAIASRLNYLLILDIMDVQQSLSQSSALESLFGGLEIELEEADLEELLLDEHLKDELNEVREGNVVSLNEYKGKKNDKSPE
jgi:hypothetical protein